MPSLFALFTVLLLPSAFMLATSIVVGLVESKPTSDIEEPMVEAEVV